jgi:hypothetical protein
MSAKSNSHKIDGKTYLFTKKITAEEAARRIAKKKEDVMPTGLPRDSGDAPAPKAPAAPADPPDIPEDDDDEKIQASSYARRYRKSKKKGVVGYNKLASPQTYKDKSVMKSSEYNPLTRVKPLRPNLLDVAQVNALNMNMAKRAASGYQWAIVDQK